MTVPVIMFENVFLGEVDIAHAVGRHVHTQPDTEYTLHIIVILMELRKEPLKKKRKKLFWICIKMDVT